MPVAEKSHTINGPYEGEGDAYIHFFHTDRKIQCFYLLKCVETFHIIFFYFLQKAMLTRVSFLTDLAGGSLGVHWRFTGGSAIFWGFAGGLLRVRWGFSINLLGGDA